MVDISAKKVDHATAKAAGFVRMQTSPPLSLSRRRLLPKGDLFQIAKIAGIMAAKRNAELIPMCHPLALSFIDVTIDLDYDAGGVRIQFRNTAGGKNRRGDGSPDGGIRGCSDGLRYVQGRG